MDWLLWDLFSASVSYIKYFIIHFLSCFCLLPTSPSWNHPWQMCIIQNHMHFHMFVMRSATLQCVGHKNVIMEYICLIPLWLWSLAVKINPDSDNILSWRDNGQYLEISYSVSHRRRPCDDGYRKHKQAALTEDSEDKQSADVLSSETQRVKTSSWATLCVCVFLQRQLWGFQEIFHQMPPKQPHQWEEPANTTPARGVVPKLCKSVVACSYMLNWIT